MKTVLALACLAASASAQRILISAPADMSTITPGSNITVEVDKPNSLTGSTEVGIAIGLWPCGGQSCAATNVSGILGDLLYSGPFNPQYDNSNPAKPPHQNFTITVPASFTSGQVSLGVAHLEVVGASGTPFYEFVNATLVVQ